MNKLVSTFVVALFFCSLSVTPFAIGQDWPALRGADGRGHAGNIGLIKSEGDVGLKIRWKKKIGSGYSSVIVANQMVIAMYCDDNNDRIGCFSAEDGTENWTYPIGPKFKGENGSFDGPISTPVVHDGKVYCFSAQGVLFCLNMKDGSEVWKKDVVAEAKADHPEFNRPLYGFATSPMIWENILILQSGVEDGSLIGVDLKDGSTLWSATTDSINSQSPALVTIEGQDIVLAAGGKLLCGVDPATGKVLFEHEHEGGNGSAMVPVVFDGNKVLMTLDDKHSTAISIRKAGENYQISEEWQEPTIKNTYNIPVLHEGNLFAYSTRILTSVDAETGEANWKSRKPGDGFLVVVDGHIIANTKKGSLHVIKATGDEYEEVASLKVFDDLVWSLPAYSDNSIFMRSLGELARVDFVGNDAGAIVKTEESQKSAMQVLVAKANANGQPELINEFVAKQNSFPIVEENGLVTFVFEGKANDVAVASDIFGARQERKMERADGTDYWFYTLALPKGLRANYMFLVDYQPTLDPKNPRQMTSSMYAGEMEFAVRLRGAPPLEMNWFGMSDWDQPDFVSSDVEAKPKADEESSLAGSMIEKTLESEILKTSITFSTYVPKGADREGAERLPVIYFLDGKGAMSNGRMHEVADSFFESGKSPTKAFLVFASSPPGPDSMKFLIEELVPMVDKEFNTLADRKARFCVANGMVASGGLSVLGQHSDTFGGAVVQTPLVFDAAQANAIKELSELKNPCHLYLEWGKFDMFNPDENWDVRKTGQTLTSELREAENLKLHGGEVLDTTDWISWRNRFDRIVAVLNESLTSK